MPQGLPNGRYAPTLKKLVIETMLKENLNYRAACWCLVVNSIRVIRNRERIDPTEGPEGFAIERRGRSSKEGRRSHFHLCVYFLIHSGGSGASVGICCTV